MTARQRAMFERKTDTEPNSSVEQLMSLPTGYKEKVMTAEAIQKAALKSQKRKQLADEKREKDKVLIFITVPLKTKLIKFLLFHLIIYGRKVCKIITFFKEKNNGKATQETRIKSIQSHQQGKSIQTTSAPSNISFNDRRKFYIITTWWRFSTLSHQRVSVIYFFFIS